jgi:hypothetical protein
MANSMREEIRTKLAGAWTKDHVGDISTRIELRQKDVPSYEAWMRAQGVTLKIFRIPGDSARRTAEVIRASIPKFTEFMGDRITIADKETVQVASR